MINSYLVSITHQFQAVPQVTQLAKPGLNFTFLSVPLLSHCHPKAERNFFRDITRMQALTENLDASIEKVQQLVQPDHDYGVHEMDGGDFVPPTGSVQDEFKKIEGKLVEVPGAIQRIEELRETLYMSRQELKLKKGEIDPHETAQQRYQFLAS